MGEKHSLTFFSNNISLVIHSNSRSEPFISLRFFNNENIEKSSNNQQKEGKYNLEAIIMILEVAKKKRDSWSNILSSKEEVSIVKWEEQNLTINIENYSIVLNDSQTLLLKFLLKHLISEKIKYTEQLLSPESVNFQRKTQFNHERFKKSNVITKKLNNTKVKIKKTIKRDVKQITGTIKFETNKAILLNISGEEAWIPKSVIRSLFKSWSDKEQLFYIDSWFLEKNQNLVNNSQ